MHRTILTAVFMKRILPAAWTGARQSLLQPGRYGCGGSEGTQRPSHTAKADTRRQCQLHAERYGTARSGPTASTGLPITWDGTQFGIAVEEEVEPHDGSAKDRARWRIPFIPRARIPTTRKREEDGANTLVATGLQGPADHLRRTYYIVRKAHADRVRKAAGLS